MESANVKVNSSNIDILLPQNILQLMEINMKKICLL